MGTQVKNDVRTWRHPLVVTHAGVVAGLIVLLAVLAGTYDGPDANIGAGFLGLLLGLLGAPWSLAYFVLGSLSDTEAAAPAAVFICLAAAVNVVLHALIRTWRVRRGSSVA
jgi:hypothetical protein